MTNSDVFGHSEHECAQLEKANINQLCSSSKLSKRQIDQILIHPFITGPFVMFVVL